jgi:hypothetical protein
MTPVQRRSMTSLVLVFAGCAWLVIVEDRYWQRCGSLLFLASVVAQVWPVPREPWH